MPRGTMEAVEALKRKYLRGFYAGVDSGGGTGRRQGRAAESYREEGLTSEEDEDSDDYDDVVDGFVDAGESGDDLDEYDDEDEDEDEDEDDNGEEDAHARGYNGGTRLATHEKMEFEKFVRDVLYGKRIKERPMQAVKSRIMFGVANMLAQGCVVLLMAIQANDRFHMSLPMRVASTGASVGRLLHAKCWLALASGAWGMWAWFRRLLLRRDVVIVYLTLRAGEAFFNAWLTVALLKDFKRLPYQTDTGMAAGEKAIYFFGLMICGYSLVNSCLHVRALSREWDEYQVRAHSAYRQALAENKLRRQTSVARRGEVVPRELFNAIAAPSHAAKESDAVHINMNAPVLAMEAAMPLAEDPIDGLQVHYPQQQTQNGFLDAFATITPDECTVRWASMPVSGSFSRQVGRVPDVNEMAAHLSTRGFQLVYSDQATITGTTNDGGEEQQRDVTRMYAFAQSQGAVFLCELSFDEADTALHATIKSHDEAKTATFCQRLELNHLLLPQES